MTTIIDIQEGAKFKTSNGIVWIIDSIEGNRVRTSMSHGAKGNYCDDINEVVSFLNEEGATILQDVKKQYVLKLEGLNLYLATKQGLSGCNLTEDVKKAMKFDERDNTETKIAIWSITAQRMMNNKDVKFEIVYL